jgi:hypothetical protein
MLAKGLGLLEEATAASQQVFALGCQLDSAADAIEQRNSKLRLEGLDLARSGRLAQVQAFMSRRKTAGFRHGHERMQLPKIHIDAFFA